MKKTTFNLKKFQSALILHRQVEKGISISDAATELAYITDTEYKKLEKGDCPTVYQLEIVCAWMGKSHLEYFEGFAASTKD